MSRVISYTPEWLMRPNPGWEMFTSKTPSSKSPISQDDTGRRKTIATRDTEIFVAVGTEIRWADLLALKEGENGYRTLKVAVPLPITQLVVSPNGDFMAVATAHTVHVVVLPEPAVLEGPPSTDPIKLKTFQVGPTAHVREQAPVVSLMWHPLGYRGHCLVTITRDGVVRLWEVNRSDRSTFSEPTLSIDLKKLANATNDKEDVSAAKLGASKGFSPDSFELEVASACFGDYPDQEGVHGWAPMTLWIAMVEGDVYALCPLLPSKWQLPETPGVFTLIETLATSINADYAEVQDNKEASKQQEETVERQLSWLSDILYAEPLPEKLPSGDSISVFSRPSSVPACPLLQGPFTISAEDVDDFEISDMIVFSLKTFSESVEDGPAEGLPGAVVCLLTDTSKVHICLDILGIVGRWLPSSPPQHISPESTAQELILTETVALADDDTPSFNQSITPDVQKDFSFFVSRSQGVYSITLEPWIRNLENELAEPQSEGLTFRLDRLLESAGTQVDLCMSRTGTHAASEEAPEEVNSCVVVAEGNLGYFVLTTVANEPQAVFLDAPEYGFPSEKELAEYMLVEVPSRQSRPAYQPPKELYDPLQFHIDKERFIPARHKASSKEEMKLSPANLDILMNAHKALSQDTHRLQTAVSDLFIRCTRLREEFRDQVVRVAELVAKVDGVTGNDEGADGDVDGYTNAKIEERLDKVKAKQEAITARYEAIRRKMASIGGTELSEKESAFVEELQTMERSLDHEAQTLTGDQDGSEVPAWERLGKIKGLKKDLAIEAERATREMEGERGAAVIKVPSHSRKQEQEQIEALLQREAALITAAAKSLRAMGIDVPVDDAKW
ncbi:uncharacterized protein EI97DRAFT_437021 [Westerdykella ornata]|uniref:Uncharacterized protein n=1 Tax=Westerdykella ornata TaxID=318751 RepID=A0A6A6J8R6_WESOR|nr:uncharacterized protein EI97DRAFT_437021 [Westerdykella ornata]KAF2272398.1 hypothetical protein EI97DRAFT_437021 [Westerdykella ornata]